MVIGEGAALMALFTKDSLSAKARIHHLTTSDYKGQTKHSRWIGMVMAQSCKHSSIAHG
jgi:hypothetical protein